MTTLFADELGQAAGSLQISQRQGVATVRIHRPATKNAITYEMWTALARVMPALAARRDVDAVIFRGSDGGPFSSGADITEFTSLRADPSSTARYNEAVREGEAAIVSFPRPTIAMVQGYAIGGGTQIALACDFRLCDHSAQFALTPSKIGLVYPVESTRRLVSTVGAPWARWILYTGQRVDARQAKAIGLVHDVYGEDDLEGEAHILAAHFAGLARVSVEGAKAIIDEYLQVQDIAENGIADLVNESADSTEYAEGVAAFLDKRQARFDLARSTVTPPGK